MCDAQSYSHRRKRKALTSEAFALPSKDTLLANFLERCGRKSQEAGKPFIFILLWVLLIPSNPLCFHHFSTLALCSGKARKICIWFNSTTAVVCISLHFLRGGLVPPDKDVAGCLQKLNTFSETRCIFLPSLQDIDIPNVATCCFSQCDYISMQGWGSVGVHTPICRTWTCRILARKGFGDGRAESEWWRKAGRRRGKAKTLTSSTKDSPP